MKVSFSPDMIPTGLKTPINQLTNSSEGGGGRGEETSVLCCWQIWSVLSSVYRLVYCVTGGSEECCAMCTD